MLRLYPSNKTESLAAVMAALMKADPLSDPFANETVLIPSQGMGVWLRQELSSHLGIAAMIDTQMPAAFIWKLSQKLSPEAGVAPHFEKRYLAWEIFQRLPELLEGESFSAVRDYLLSQLASENPGQTAPDLSLSTLPESALFSLSQNLADLFDAYQNYRADWLESWEQGQGVLQGGAAHLARLETWQSELWQALYPELGERRHRPAQLLNLRALLESGKFDHGLLPKRLFVFGLASLPPAWLPVFVLLARHIDIHFLLQNPCELYWADIQTPMQQMRFQQTLLKKGISPDTVEASTRNWLENNALLASWGKLGREALGALYEYEDSRDVEEYTASLFDPWGADTAIACLQQDILELQSRQHKVSEEDKSIRFASCHSRLREVEALKDHLLGALDADPSLGLKDIIVMMPNVQDYAPLVEAVFSQPVQSKDGKKIALNFAISDQSIAHEQSLVDALQQILTLSSSRLTVSDVLDLLDAAPVRERFELDTHEQEQIHEWVRELNVRWGLDAGHRSKHLGEPVRWQGQTWLKAMRRLLAGFVWGQVDLAEMDGEAILPAVLQGGEGQALLGKLLRFFELLAETSETLSRKHEAQQWPGILASVFSQWFAFESLPESFSRLLDKMSETLREEFSVTQLTQALDASVVMSAIQSHLEQSQVSQRFLAGRINFCTLMPMRSIPFRLVCLIGMNEGEYPRPTRRSGFDLMALTPARRGDRSRREEDRYLFLEALLSVRESVYISYCGHDARDNSERFPSLLVSELQDYCRQHYGLTGPSGQDLDDIDPVAHWTTEHRLQAFHADYFKAGPRQSYAREWLPLFQAQPAKSIIQGSQTEAHESKADVRFDKDPHTQEHGNEPVSLTLEELSVALSEPLKYFYRNALGASPVSLNDLPQDVESFAFDGLDRFRFRQEMLVQQSAMTESSHQENAEAVRARWQHEDRMPPPPLDQLETETILSESEDMLARVSSLSDLAYQNFSLVLGRYRIEGRLLCAASGPVSLYLSKNPGKHLFAHWVKHVFWNLYRTQCIRSGTESPRAGGESRLIGTETTWCFPALNKENEERLEESATELLVDYEKLCVQPMAFMPATAFAQLFETPSKAQARFWGGQFAGASDSADFYWQRACTLGELSCAPEQSPERLRAGEMPDFLHYALYRQLAEAAEMIQEASQ